MIDAHRPDYTRTPNDSSPPRGSGGRRGEGRGVMMMMMTTTAGCCFRVWGGWGGKCAALRSHFLLPPRPPAPGVCRPGPGVGAVFVFWGGGGGGPDDDDDDAGEEEMEEEEDYCDR
jgi:hypothetical protein